MEDAELVKKLVSEIENKKKDSNKTTDILEGMNETRTVSLKEAIEEIQGQMDFRQKLHEEMMKNIEELKSTINNMIPSMNTENANIIVEFQKKLVEAEEMKIQEKLDCFRDIAQLKKELREWIREFRDKEKRASMLGELLSE